MSDAQVCSDPIIAQITARETGNDYPSIILDADTRVVECANAIQWIVQKHIGGRWRSRYFCRTKEGLLLYARPITPELLALPDRFPDDRGYSVVAPQQATRGPALGQTRCGHPLHTPVGRAVDGTEPIFVKAADGDFSVVGANTGAVISEGLPSEIEARRFVDGFDDARQRFGRRRKSR